MLDMLRRLTRNEHEWVRENLSPYLDDMVSLRESARIEKHLAQCAECRAELEELRQTVALLNMVPELPLPRSFLVPLSEGRKAPARGSQWSYGAWRTASAIASFALVAVVSANLAFRSGLLSMGAQLASDSVEPLMVATESEAPQAAEIMLEREAAVQKSVASTVVVEKAMPVEKVVRETVVVEKEIAVEKVVVQTVVVEKEVAAEKEAPAERAANPPPRTAATDVAPLPEIGVASAAKELEVAPEAEAAAVTNAPPAIPEGVPTAAGAGVLMAAEEPAAKSLAATPAPTAANDAVEAPVVVADSTYDEGHSDLTEVSSQPARTRWFSLRTLLDGAMWVLLIATIALWAVTATLSRQRR